MAVECLLLYQKVTSLPQRRECAEKNQKHVHCHCKDVQFHKGFRVIEQFLSFFAEFHWFSLFIIDSLLIFFSAFTIDCADVTQKLKVVDKQCSFTTVSIVYKQCSDTRNSFNYSNCNCNCNSNLTTQCHKPQFTL